MTKKELEKEAEEYALKQWEGNLPWSVIQKSYYDGALPREKQIEIDAEQIRALQKQNGELTDRLTKAKELLKKFMPYVIESYLKQDISNIKLSFSEIEEADQFLKENK